MTKTIILAIVAGGFTVGAPALARAPQAAAVRTVELRTCAADICRTQPARRPIARIALTRTETAASVAAQGRRELDALIARLD